jgi:hypothetical protein
MKISQLKKQINTISTGPRIGHFIIDLFIIQIITYLVELFPISEIGSLLVFLLFPAYYIGFEYFYQWTPGKYITGTIVIDDYGKKPDIQTIILRTFIRFVPFEPFSCFDTKSWGWHDSWTKTYVIKKEELPVIMEKLGQMMDTGVVVEDQKSVKMKKSFLIIAIIAIISVSGYFIVMKIRETFNSAFNGFEKLDATDRELIKGEWKSNWIIYKVLNFDKDGKVVATSQNGEKLNLNYSIKSKTLTLKDDTGLALTYFIIELTDSKMILRDINTMKDNIEFERQ